MSIPVALRELDRLVMRDTAAMILPDSCVLLRFTEGDENSHGFATVSYPPDAFPTRCAFTPGGGQPEKDDQASETVLAQGRVRFDLDIVLDHRDRFELVTRFGQSLTTPAKTRTYEFVERPLTTESGYVADVRLVTNPGVEP